MDELRIVISGGGTGGHIFPAVSIANAIRELRPEAEILFIGAEGRMEMQRIPAAGYNIVGLPIRGLLRPLWKLGNAKVLWDYYKSKRMAKKILLDFKPCVAVGVGGYASSATLDVAHSLRIPLLIQEQNSFAGITNKSLAKKADRICVAYGGMERFFPKNRILLTGNPVRQGLQNPVLTKTESAAIFKLEPDLPTILLIGGSLGARTMNESILNNIDLLVKSPIQLIWQTGGNYFKTVKDKLEQYGKLKNIYVTDFISRMDLAYKAADIVLSRAGASSISELCLLGKPSILIPSPNVAEDHQTHNAMALVKNNAAVMIKDADAVETLLPTAIKMVTDTERLKTLGANAQKMAFKDSAQTIAKEILKLAKGRNDVCK